MEAQTMFTPKFTITNKINKALIEIERVRGFLDAVKLKNDWVSEMQKQALILETHYSTHIEGTEINLAQAQDLLAGKKVAGIDPDDKKELTNYKKAMNFIAKYLGKEDPITEGLIRELHKMIVQGVRGDNAQAGTYRQIQNYVANSKTKEIIYTPPSPLDVPHLMRELADWINKAVHDLPPILVSAITQFQFVHIHPFVDGNGRTARLLSTLILYKTGYDFKRLFTISEYYDQNRPAYYSAIQSVRENKMDMTDWLEYFTEGLRLQMQGIQEKGKKIIKNDNLLHELKKSGLNLRQLKAIKYLLQNDKMTPSEYRKISDCVRRTAQRDVENLIERKIIKTMAESKTDPTKYYVLVDKY
jgi:Fic family protein